MDKKRRDVLREAYNTCGITALTFDELRALIDGYERRGALLRCAANVLPVAGEDSDDYTWVPYTDSDWCQMVTITKRIDAELEGDQ